MDINRELENILLQNTNEDVSLTFLALASLSKNLKTHKFEPKVINALLLRGDEQIKSCLAQNPNISRIQWWSLLFNGSEEVSSNAKMNCSFQMTEYEMISFEKKRKASA